MVGRRLKHGCSYYQRMDLSLEVDRTRTSLSAMVFSSQENTVQGTKFEQDIGKTRCETLPNGFGRRDS
jgi:hypothetical protein